MSLANPLWSASRIHGELLKLGVDVGQTSVAKYMARRRGGPSQGWRTFLSNHADDIASTDLFVVPALSFRLPYGFLSRGTIDVELTEACGWEAVPDHVVRDHDCANGEAHVQRLRALGTRDQPAAPRLPWQNAHAERLIGSIRREILDHVVVLSKRLSLPITRFECSNDGSRRPSISAVIGPDGSIERPTGTSFPSARCVRAWL